jgi:hypothetical protein
VPFTAFRQYLLAKIQKNLENKTLCSKKLQKESKRLDIMRKITIFTAKKETFSSH